MSQVPLYSPIKRSRGPHRKSSSRKRPHKGRVQEGYPNPETLNPSPQALCLFRACTPRSQPPRSSTFYQPSEVNYLNRSGCAGFSKMVPATNRGISRQPISHSAPARIGPISASV